MDDATEAVSEIKDNGYIHVDNEEIGNRLVTTHNALTPESLSICIDFLDKVCPPVSI